MVIYLFLVMLLLILIPIVIIDSRSMRIPNALNVLLAIAGAVWAFSSVKLIFHEQLLSAAGAFSIFLLMKVGYQRLRGQAGLGMGDVKMAGASALWISPFIFPFFLFVSSSVGLILLWATQGLKSGSKIPFGPFLSFGLLTTWIWENFFL